RKAPLNRARSKTATLTVSLLTVLCQTASWQLHAPGQPRRRRNDNMRVIGLAGWSGSGKTTLVTSVIPVLLRRGLKVATVKHARHDFDQAKIPGCIGTLVRARSSSYRAG